MIVILKVSGNGKLHFTNLPQQSLELFSAFDKLAHR